MSIWNLKQKKNHISSTFLQIFSQYILQKRADEILSSSLRQLPPFPFNPQQKKKYPSGKFLKKHVFKQCKDLEKQVEEENITPDMMYLEQLSSGREKH